MIRILLAEDDGSMRVYLARALKTQPDGAAWCVGAPTTAGPELRR